MVVTLYTSRVILDALGTVDYGIYNVVGGIVVVLGFVNGALSSSTSRFLTFELGRKDQQKLKKVFAATFNIHLGFSAILVVAAETIGLWFLYHKLVIPSDRMTAAFWIYQFSIVTTCINFVQVPYRATLIAHENMAIYAYVGLYEAISKLLISYLILISPYDKLIIYGLLLMVNTIIIQYFYIWYAEKRYEECKFKLFYEKQLYRELLSYSGWDMFGGLAVICQGQGINILLNMFFGPIVNTARAIAVQIQNAITNLVNNFMVAARPQAIKRFAEGNIKGMFDLVFATAKYSYFIMLVVVVPICFELRYILKLWLGNEVPPQTYFFSLITLVTALVETIRTASLMPYHANGKIKWGNIIGGSIMILALPLSYVALRMGYSADSVFVILLLDLVVSQIFGWYIVHYYLTFRYMVLIKKVYVPCACVTLLSLFVPYAIQDVMAESFGRLVVITALSFLANTIIIYFVGMGQNERNKVTKIIYNKIINATSNNHK